MYTSPETARLADMHEAHVAAMDAFLPWWEDAEVESTPERFVSEHDYQMADIAFQDMLTDAYNGHAG